MCQREFINIHKINYRESLNSKIAKTMINKWAKALSKRPMDEFKLQLIAYLFFYLPFTSSSVLIFEVDFFLLFNLLY